MHYHQRYFLALTALVFCSTTVFGLYTHAGIVITSPPVPQPTLCPTANFLNRQESCSYGACGTDCLSQGAFCCGPAGTLATSPYWVCDNGACITSVRGSTGIVDCYDPDNPQGTTQSCIDNVPTATCSSTDRCYTCSTDEPFCFWETYIDTNSPTLRWFSCVTTKMVDATFYAATITGNLTSPTTLHPTSTSSPVLSTGAIVGVAVGGGVALIACVAIISWCCVLMRRKSQTPEPTSHNQNQYQSQVAYNSYQPAELPLTSPPQYYDQRIAQTSQTFSSTGDAAIHDEAVARTPVAELPGKTGNVGVMGMGKFERQDGERHGYEHETAYRNQNSVRETEQRHMSEREDDIVEEDTNRTSYIEGDDWQHMSPGVGFAR